MCSNVYQNAASVGKDGRKQAEGILCSIRLSNGEELSSQQIPAELGRLLLADVEILNFRRGMYVMT